MTRRDCLKTVVGVPIFMLLQACGPIFFTIMVLAEILNALNKILQSLQNGDDIEDEVKKLKAKLKENQQADGSVRFSEAEVEALGEEVERLKDKHDRIEDVVDE